MADIKLRRLSPEEVSELSVEPVDAATLKVATDILEDVKKDGEKAVLAHALRLKDINEGEPHILRKEDLHKAFQSLPVEQQNVLLRTAARIKAFAEAQKHSVNNLSFAVAGGKAGHTVTAVDVAGCYAPGGRYPLPSSVLMTVITARVAGVKTVWVASPRPAQITIAAAHVAGADALLAVGGAQAIAAFAHGAGEIPRCDAVVGPGNKYVTAAKQLVAGKVSIDMLAGPSECLVVVDKSSNPAIVAADLIAQAEHDTDARPILVNLVNNGEADIIASVEAEIKKQLSKLATAETAQQAIKHNGVAVIVNSIDAVAQVCDKFAPEHLELHLAQADRVRGRLRHFGSLFIGSLSAEVFGDYGAGPNHVLPTGGTARNNAGLSVFTFLKIRTWLEITDAQAARDVMEDAAALAKLEGLHGHAYAAEVRLQQLAPKPVATLPRGNSGLITPERPLHITQQDDSSLVKIGLPKGRMEQGLFKLLNEAGISLKVESRGYRPTVSVPGFDVKLLKPQNIVEMVNLGSRDIGFTGADLVEELGAKDLTMILNTGLDKVKLVAAAPEAILTEDGNVRPEVLSKRKIVVASEYKNIAQRWMAKRGLTSEHAIFVLSRGATEVFPPEDADIIVDNTATGSTLKANRLRAFDELLHSSTCMYVNTNLWQRTDEIAVKKRQAIEKVITLIKSVLDARERVVLEFNVAKDRLEEVCKYVPAMREPTVSSLHGGGYAVKSVVPKEHLFDLIPLIKDHGGSDVIVTQLHHIVM